MQDIFIAIRIALEKASLPFDVSGAITFGSRMTGKATPDSDFDLLIVAEDIHPKRHRRGDEIVCLKKHLPSVPIDLLLLSPREVISNFKNHNPLFLRL